VIVVVTNTIAYLFFTGEHTAEAEMVMEKDPDWVAPLLWRSEFRNVIRNYLRRGLLTLVQALQIAEQAEFLMLGNEFEITSSKVLSLVSSSNCSAYDCEFVALARNWESPWLRPICGYWPSSALSPFHREPSFPRHKTDKDNQCRNFPGIFPCPNVKYIFYALSQGLFPRLLASTLRWPTWKCSTSSEKGALDISKISVSAVPHIFDRTAPALGGAIGRGCGRMLSPRACSHADLRDATIACGQADDRAPALGLNGFFGDIALRCCSTVSCPPSHPGRSRPG